MAILSSQTEQGNGSIAFLENGVFECSPALTEAVIKAGKTNTWHMWHSKATGEVGEKIRIKLNWPEYDPDLVPDEIKNMPNYEAEWESFVTAARDVVFMSTDRINWQRIEDVKLEDNTLYFEATLPAKEVWFTVSLYYTPCRYADLLEAVKDNDYIKTLNIGADQGGDTIYAFEATDYSVPESNKIRVHFQGAIHCSEFNGAWLCDFMLRYIASGCDEVKAILKKYIFTFIPVVSVTSWRLGLDVHSSGINPNRDWVEKTLPSTISVHEYLQKMNTAPYLLFDIHSGIANYGCWEICQALSLNTNLPVEQQKEMTHFIDLVYENCDFLPTRRYWDALVTDDMFDGYGVIYGITYTMEVSHYAMYDRQEGHHFSIDMPRLEKFARQLIHTVDKFFEEKGEK